MSVREALHAATLNVRPSPDDGCLGSLSRPPFVNTADWQAIWANPTRSIETERLLGDSRTRERKVTGS